MTNPSSGLSQPVRRVNPRPPSRERVPRFSRTKRRVSRTVHTSSASRTPTATQGASFSGFPEQCGDYFLHVAHTHAASYSRPPHMERASPASPNSAASFPNCPNQCGESSSDRAQGASFSGFPELSNQCGESSPDRQAMRRASPAFPNCPNLCGELFPPDCHIQCGELFPESHAVRRTALRTKTAHSTHHR